MVRMQQLDDGVSKRLAEKLTRLQGERSDAEFARLLGCTRPHWHHIRSGKRRVSYAMVKRAAVHFPELYPIVMRDLVAQPAEPAEAVAS